jgi:hypothetical protein
MQKMKGGGMLEAIIQNLSMKSIIDFAEIVMLIYALYKFTRKPTDSLDQRVTTLEVKLNEHERKLRQGNDKFWSYGNVMETLVRCTLALMKFEVHYCESEHKEISDDLVTAEKDLNDCLTRIMRGTRREDDESD